MYDQSFNKRSLSRVFHKLDFVNINNPEDLEPFRTHILEGAIATATTGFTTTENPLKCFSLRGRQVFMFHKLSDEIVARKICSNIKMASKYAPRGRSQIVKNLQLLLEEGIPFRVYRLDVKSFYESFDTSNAKSKIEAIDELSPLSKKLVQDLLGCHAALGGTGIPRGLALSAALAEYLMQDFDHQVSGHKEVFFFARYVDDIIVITSAREDVNIFLRQIKSPLPPGLCWNSTKRRVEEALDCVAPTKTNTPTVRLFNFDYLGYSFNVNEPVKETTKTKKSPHRIVLIDIAKKKITRFKTRISRSFLDFAKTGDWNLLKDRIKFLTKNYSVYNAKAGGKKIAGIFYSYPLVTKNAEGLASLDAFLRHATLSKSGRTASLTSPKLTGWQKRELLSNSFVDGHTKASFVHFSGPRLKQIQKCWKN